ncbi:hypothetical protein EIP86_005915 [Pleurotus ostreatoroseus]|nr:hypothetical protein EIP86_005915 [Pleurotus ostreatoroseus]
MPSVLDSPPRAPPAKYRTPLGTRWEKEKAAAGSGAFDYPDDARFVGPWVVGECVGKGASGHVKVARHRRTGQLAAVKILPLQPFAASRATDAASQAKSEKQRLGVDREITMMKLMDHPNVMRIFDVYEGEKELYLILEYVEGGELFDFLVNRGKLPPLEALGYFKQIVYGLNYAHTFSIIHRDLKPENILIHSLDPPLIKIADWGMAAFAPPTLQLETSCGSPHYASPEIVNGHRYTGTATDIWSCGVILYALLTGRLPFDDKNVRTLLGKVKTGRYDMPAFIDPVAKDLLGRMLVVDVRKRISMAEILAHPWLEGFTPGILYVPAPPVSELAKPLASAAHIDRDLFQSLCVIWGRHCDLDSIKADLLSPPGEGTLAKAFYFLLQKHRERAMEQHGILMDDILKSPGKVVTKQYSAPKARPRKACSETLPHAEIQATAQHLRAIQRASASSSRAPSPARAAPLALQIPPDRTSSRAHPPSPVGPRPQRPRPTSSPVGDPRLAGLVAPGAYLPKQDARARLRAGAHAPSLDSAAAAETARAAQQMSEMIASLPHHSQPLPPRRNTAHSVSFLGRAPLGGGGVGNGGGGGGGVLGQPLRDVEMPSVSSVIHAPVPVQASPAKILPMITAPRVRDPDLQKQMDQYASMVNAQAISFNSGRPADSVLSPVAAQDVSVNVVSSPPGSSGVQSMSTGAPSVSTGAHGSASGAGRHSHAHTNENAGENKENVEYQRNVPVKKSSQGGLGFGNSVPMPVAPMGKEMANLMYFNGAEKRRERKPHHHRKYTDSSLGRVMLIRSPCSAASAPPSFDMVGSPNLQKRPTFSTIGSPTLMSPQTSSLLGSPAVGEFKGWFSNLFHWKVQSYLLYSTDDVVATRTEALRLLDAFGVAVLEDQWGVIKCRVDDAYDGAALVLKQMRFRVEITPVAASACAPSGTTPRLAQSYNQSQNQHQGQHQHPMSPQAGSISALRSRSQFERIQGYETVIALVLEKGSVATFKQVHQRLKGEWRLDALQSPRSAAGAGSSMGTGMATPGFEQQQRVQV